MERSDALREAAKVVEVLEAAGVLVEDVSVAEGEDGGSPLALRLRLPEESLDLPVVERGSEPSLRAGSSADDEAGPDGKSPEQVRCPVADCEETFDSDHGTKIHVAKRHGDVPAHRDPERLAAVYERHDTFSAMRDALDADVTAQTVRRNMMKHGIHDPEEAGDHDPEGSDGHDSVGSGGRSPAEGSGHDPEAGGGDDADAAVEDREEPAADGRSAATDGGAAHLPSGVGATLDLPGDVPAGEFVKVVADARTLFDVQRALDLDRQEAKSLLADLDLLEFVHGRVADGGQRSETPVEDVEKRLRRQAG